MTTLKPNFISYILICYHDDYSFSILLTYIFFFWFKIYLEYKYLDFVHIFDFCYFFVIIMNGISEPNDFFLKYRDERVFNDPRSVEECMQEFDQNGYVTLYDTDNLFFCLRIYQLIPENYNLDYFFISFFTNRTMKIVFGNNFCLIFGGLLKSSAFYIYILICRNWMTDVVCF